MKKILVTGSTGFLGSYLAKELATEYKIIATKRSQTNYRRINDICEQIIWVNTDNVTNLEKIFQQHSIYATIHCATQYGRKEVENLETIDANLILPLRILELCQKYQTKIFINTDTILDKRMNYYSFSKSQFKDWLKFCSPKLVCINAELEHFYGPGDDESKFVTWLIHSLLKNMSELDLTLGEQTRNFIYISDVVAAFTLLLQKASSFKNGFYNFQIGSKNNIKIRDFVMLIKNLTENKITVLNFGARPYRENEIMNIHLNTKPLNELGWTELISLQDGLRKTIELDKITIQGDIK
jgi:nucleoside-diphosphate-sugar epimerase